jgi:protein phosphatase 1 regulatory subunit 7
LRAAHEKLNRIVVIAPRCNPIYKPDKSIPSLTTTIMSDDEMSTGSNSAAAPALKEPNPSIIQFGSVRVQQQQAQPAAGVGASTNDTTDNTTTAADNATNNPLSLGWTQLGPSAPAIRYPADVADIFPDEDEVLLVGTAGQKITHIGRDFSQQVSPQLKSLVLRSHLIKQMEGLEGLAHLDVLELYDNQVQALECLGDGPNGAPGCNLRVLDISYNSIRDLQPVELCPNLQELCEFLLLCKTVFVVNWLLCASLPLAHHYDIHTDIANNKLKSMAGLRNLVHLKKIDLGANRLRVMDPNELANLVNLEELWLGKNKIEKIQGLDNLKKLRRLDVQSNRLEVIEGLTSVNDTLEELFLAHNGITVEGAFTPTGLQLSLPNLNVLDLCRNRLTNATPFAHLTSLDELWLSGNKIASFADVACLTSLGKSLDTIYLEYNPLQEDPLYRKRIAELLPSLSQIDANMIQGLTAHGMEPVVLNAGSAYETDEVRLKRLRDEAIDRARKETDAMKQKQADGGCSLE